MKKIFYLLVTLLFTFSLFSCKKTKQITLSYEKNEIEIFVGDEVNVKPKVEVGKKVKNYELKYALSEDIATVKDGKLVAKKAGTAVLTVTTNVNEKAVATMTIVIKEKLYTIALDVNGGDKLEESTITKTAGSTIELPTPTREGYNFLGWYNGEVKFEETVMPEANITLVAKWAEIVYTVTFKDYDGTVLKEEVVSYGTDATAPTPNREGYTFKGWDKEYTNVLSDLELTAQYEIITYTITFDSNGGNEIEDIEFTVETKNIELPTPTREGYTFLGWYEEETKVETIENRNYELNAKWAEIVYTVTFKDYDGTVLKEEVVSYGTDATAPTVEPREGYTFKGWDKEYTKVLSDLELNAQYELITYTITFDSNGGNELENIEFTIETKNIELPTPTREGYTFLGWYEEEVKVETIENRNYELTAKWEKLLPTIFIEKVEYQIEVGDQLILEPTTDYQYNIDVIVFGTIIEDDSIISKDLNNQLMLTGLKVGETKVTIYLFDYEQVNKTITIKVNKKPVIDAIQPVINVEGGLETKLNWGKEFDPLKGVVALDNIDGNITDKIQVNGQVNNKKYGTYELIYSVKDEAGNKTSVTRKVNVVWDYEVGFIGHAGCYYGVMNTEDAFLYAVKELQYQLVECDVKQTSDGVFVTCHDDTFGGYTLSTTTWNTIKDVIVTSKRTSGYPSQYGETVGTYTSKICTLERYLKICKEYGAIAVVELKSSKGISNSDQSRMSALMKVIENAGMLNQVIFLGSAYNCLIWVKQNGYEYIPCQYLVNSCESDTILDRCITYGLDVSINVTGGYSNSEEWIAKYHDAGLKVSTYTYTQWTDYKEVQSWIDKGVDYLTCDWHRIDKLNLPDKADSVYYNVVFKDVDGTVLKESKVKQGRTAAAPKVEAPMGYEFIGWDKDIKNINSNLEVIAKYELIEYNITYDSNLYIMTEQSWNSKEEFVTEFYNDLFTWITENINNVDGLSYDNGSYKLKINNTTEGTATFTNANDIRALDIYYFERTFGTLIYKPIEGTNSKDYIPEVDDNYFLNSEPYRSKYINMNAYLYNVVKTAYSSYSAEYKQQTNNRVQIFFRFHQWAKGTKIDAFNNYPTKYTIRYMTGVEATMPTTPMKYTIEDELILNNPISTIEFLGWYLDRECTGDKITKINKGTTGNMTLYAKWEEIEIQEVYSDIVYNLNGGLNNPKNMSTYLEGISTSLYEPTKEGYEFIGWSTDKDGKNIILMISEKNSGEVILHANWKVITYKISYELGEGEWGNNPVFNGDPITSINSTANSGFWTGYSDNIYLYKVTSFSADLNAQYSYRVGIKYDSVSKLYKVVSISTSGNASFDYSNVDYILVISGSYKQYSSTSEFRTNVTIGQYVLITGTPNTGIATLKFYSASSISGTKIENYVDEYTVESTNLLLPIPKCDGKVFKGWSINEDLSGPLYMNVPIGIIGNIILYAVF